MYCGEAKAKIPRHLLSQHKEEPEVVKYKLEKDQQVRDLMMLKLRNIGNHRHNTEVIRENKGLLVVAYRPTCSTSPADNFIPCEHCLGYYSAHDLWKHVKRCPLLRNSIKQKPHRRIQQSSRLLLPPPKGTSIGLNSVLSSMIKDEVGQIVKGDRLILQLGEKVFLKSGHDRDQHCYIRNVLRELDRLLKDLRQSTQNMSANLIHFIDPIHFMSVVKSARSVAGFSDETHIYQTPSLALKLGHSIKKCSKILKGNGLQNGDDDLVARASAFWELCELNWTDEVSTHALRTLNGNHRNKPKLIPLTEDVTTFTKYLKKIGEEAFDTLNRDNQDSQHWCQLNEAAVCQLILFNRRRQGEVSKMKLEDYSKKQLVIQDDITPTLSPLERKLCQTIQRIEIVGKRGRTVPLLITRDMMKWVDLLICCREAVGVNPANQYVFALCRYGSVGHLRGCDCLRAHSESSGAKFPDLLRSTKLRKQIGTLSQLLNLKDNELDILSNFLGHDIRVHREFYRMPQETLQVAKVSKLLLSMEKGVFASQHGKSLDDIEVDLDEEAFAEEEDENEPYEENGSHPVSLSEACTEEEHEDETNEGNGTLVPLSGAVGPVRGRKRKTPPARDRSAVAAGLSDASGDGPKKAGMKRRKLWSDEESAAVMRHFTTHILIGKIPQKREVDACVAKEDCLRQSNRTWRNIKDFVRNKLVSKKSKQLF